MRKKKKKERSSRSCQKFSPMIKTHHTIFLMNIIIKKKKYTSYTQIGIEMRRIHITIVVRFIFKNIYSNIFIKMKKRKL